MKLMQLLMFVKKRFFKMIDGLILTACQRVYRYVMHRSLGILNIYIFCGVISLKFLYMFLSSNTNF